MAILANLQKGTDAKIGLLRNCVCLFDVVIKSCIKTLDTVHVRPLNILLHFCMLHYFRMINIWFVMIVLIDNNTYSTVMLLHVKNHYISVTQFSFKNISLFCMNDCKFLCCSKIFQMILYIN